MAIQKQVVRQNDFSAGQLSASALRADNKKIVRAGARTMENFRIRNSGACESRPGRQGLFISAGRTDKIRLGADETFKLCFGNAKLEIRDDDNAIIATDSSRPWNLAGVVDIVWTIFGNDVIICYPGMKPRVATWSGSAWSFADFAFSNGPGNTKQAPFYRIPSTRGITMDISATAAGATTNAVTFSAAVLSASHVGSIFRYHGAQLQITAYTSPTAGTATNLEQLPHTRRYEVATSDGFSVGEIVEGSTTGYQAEIRNVPDATHLDVILIDGKRLSVGENIIGSNASEEITADGGAISATSTPVWDEQIISDARGWPRSCASHANRLIFCDLPGLPEGIIWSAIGNAYNLMAAADADDAIIETIADKQRIYHVLGVADQFVFTDHGVKYVPISEGNPLAPGSVSFREILSIPAGPVKPVNTHEGILYVDAGLDRIVAVIQTGQTAAPYVARDISEFHSDLFSSPVAMAATIGGIVYPEWYVFVLNNDGTVAVGKYNAEGWVGWVPWTGTGTVEWISAFDESLFLTTKYAPPGGDVRLVEYVAADTYLDAQVAVNDLPPELEPSGGDGPLWWLAGETVTLMDGLLYMGTREVDEDGEIVPEEGDDLTSVTLVAGLEFDSTLVPFIAHAGEGQSVKQSMRRRKIARIGVAAQDSVGFVVDGKRIARYANDEDQAEAPEPREEVHFFRKLGRAVDPTVTLERDVPGPLRIVEVSYEVTV